jgi:hypothetical protein
MARSRFPQHADVEYVEDNDTFAEAASKKHDVIAELSVVRDLIKWIAPLIQVVDGNGKKTQRFCGLCAVARRAHKPCRHAEIFAYLENK